MPCILICHFLFYWIWFKIQWNHSYLWGPMLVDYQNFDGLLGLSFVGNWSVALKCITIYKSVVHSWARAFRGRGSRRNPWTLTPTNNNESTVFFCRNLYFTWLGCLIFIHWRICFTVKLWKVLTSCIVILLLLIIIVKNMEEDKTMLF